MSEIWNLSALCRCCHAGDGALRSLQAPYVHEGTIEIYAVMLRDTFGLHINPPTIEASYSICESCIELLHLACQFKKRVQVCEKKFQEYCENERTLTMSDNVKMEIENDSVILNPVVDDIDDGCGDTDDSDGGYSEVESEFEGTGKKSDREAKIKTKFCQFCNELFETATERRSHVFQVHVADGSSCKLCEGTFRNRKELRRHFKSHHGGVMRCSFCTEVFPSSEGRETHEREQHTKLTGYVCDHCQKSFKLKISLLSHMNWHKRGKDFICQKCGYAFKKNHALKVHIETVHENQRRYQCNLCGKTYKCNKSLQLHYYSHTGELPFKCQTCEKGFKTKTDLRYHMERFDHDMGDEKDDNVGWNLGGDDGGDDDGEGDDSDGGYGDNEIEADFSKQNIEVEIIPESKTVLKKQENKFEPSVHDIKIEIEECVYETEEHIDSPDDREYFYDDDVSNDFEVGIEECKTDKNVDVKIKSKATNGAKGKLNKHKGKHVKKLSDNYEYKLTCDFCKEQFTSKKELLGHYSDKHIPKDFSCKLCNSSFSERSGIIKHLMSKHEIKTFYCQYCIETFKNLRALQLHLNFHTKNGYICDCCQKTFKWKKTLMRHLAWQMGIFEQFPCETCGRAFKLLSNLQAHIRSVHEKRKPFKCDMCEKSFTLKKHLVSHRRLHTGERPFSCDICSKTFVNKHNMKSHRQKHEGAARENPRVQCDVCGKYCTKHTIKQHMDCHLKPYKCELCHQGFSAKALLIRHAKRHKRDQERKSPGSNTFICEICNKSYYNWDIHKRVHEKKPFNCNLCDKFYAEKITLDRHVQLKHYKERKHSCDVCDKMFTRPESVRLHKERKHNGDREKNKKERKNKRKIGKDTKLRAVKVEKLDVNFDSALPAYAIPNIGSADDIYTDTAAENSFLGN